MVVYTTTTVNEVLNSLFSNKIVLNHISISDDVVIGEMINWLTDLLGDETWVFDQFFRYKKRADFPERTWCWFWEDLVGSKTRNFYFTHIEDAIFFKMRWS